MVGPYKSNVGAGNRLHDLHGADQNQEKASTLTSTTDNFEVMAAIHSFVIDFVGLPIIISDYDALTNSPTSTPSSNGSIDNAQTTSRQSTLSSTTVSQAYSSGTASAMQQNWSTGFSDFADDLWAKMTQGMKQKLREACVEVLKKTEEAEPEHMEWQYDDDARFLD